MTLKLLHVMNNRKSEMEFRKELDSYYGKARRIKIDFNEKLLYFLVEYWSMLVGTVLCFNCAVSIPGKK